MVQNDLVDQGADGALGHLTAAVELQVFVVHTEAL